MGAVEAWFGERFGELHPLLQRLHRDGGELCGDVELAFAPGLAGWLGRRIARGLGLPPAPGRHPLMVAIRSEDGVLHWDRQFDGHLKFASRFTPRGHYPDGDWLEQSGKVQLRLQVRVVDGGWHWYHVGSRIGMLPLPVALLPRAVAFKEVVDGKYRFMVTVQVPVLGKVLSYGGLLAAKGTLGTSLCSEHQPTKSAPLSTTSGPR